MAYLTPRNPFQNVYGMDPISTSGVNTNITSGLSPTQVINDQVRQIMHMKDQIEKLQAQLAAEKNSYNQLHQEARNTLNLLIEIEREVPEIVAGARMRRRMGIKNDA